ncbi:hypothetical protein [Halobacterium yunchengense]|uniref:hypothetical protein n=1 Tax=Halobacterium yunchengense TaxID=3108497 RepID=UPI00300B11ED
MGERIQLVVSGEQKERWDGFAEKQSGIDDRSDLIRTAVEKFIEDTNSESELPEQMESRFDEILAEFERFESRLNFANEAFESLEQSQLDEETVEDIVEFHSDLIQEEVRDLEDTVRRSDE